MARPRKAKHRNEPESLAHTLDEIESFGDQITNWMIENPRIVLGVGAVILLLAAGWGVVNAQRENAREEASAAIGTVQADFRRAMGASADEVVVPEPANPETARKVREEYVGRFQAVAKEYAGTGAGAMAGLEVGDLQEELGQLDASLETWQATLGELPKDDTLTALIALRMASVYEEQARWTDAAQAYERAADVPNFPLRETARAEAARCYAEGGDTDRALSVFARVQSEDPDVFLPEHLSSRLLELQASQRMSQPD